jgi:hypothetical protein
MFGFSLSKLVVLALVVLGAIYLFRMLAGASPRNGGPRPNGQARGRGGSRAPSSSASRVDAEDMVRCSACGTYVTARGAKACDNPACPWPR